MVWYGRYVCYGMIRYGTVGYGRVRYNVGVVELQHNMRAVCSGCGNGILYRVKIVPWSMVWYGRYGMARYGMVRYGMVRYGTVGYDMMWGSSSSTT